MIKNLRYKIPIVIVCICSLFLSIKVYSFLYERIIDMIDKKKILAFFEYDVSILEEFDNLYNSFISFFKSFSFETIKSFFSSIFSTLVIISPLLILFIEVYFLSKGILFLYLKLSTDRRYHTTKFADLLIRLVKKITSYVTNLIEYCIKRKNKIILLYLLSSGILIFLLFEILCFIYKYVESILLVTSHIMLFNFLKWCVVITVRFVTSSNIIVVIIVFLLLYYLIALSRAFKKLRINWAVFKRFVDNLGTLTIVNGAPGTGKTLSIVQMSLAQEELMLEANKDALLNYELMHPSINFSVVRLLLKFYFFDCTEEEFDKALESCPNLFLYEESLRKYMESPISENYFRVFYRNTAIVSSIGIYDPYFKSMSRKADMSSFRLFKKQTSMFHEADEVIVLPEFDKEFNSHDSKGEVSEDGTSGFFAIFSHISERSGKVFIDYQDRQQAIKRIRAIAMTYIQLEDRKVKMPAMLSLIYYPFLRVQNGLLKLINAYLIRSCKTEKRWTVRVHPLKEYKRNDVTFFYQLLKYITFLFINICSYFEKFRYFRIIGQQANNDEFKDARVFKYNLNVMDFVHEEEQKIYESIQFKRFYSDLRNELYKIKGIKQSLIEIEKWSSIDPAAAEYMKLHQRFYSKIINAQIDDNMKVREGNE